MVIIKINQGIQVQTFRKLHLPFNIKAYTYRIYMSVAKGSIQAIMAGYTNFTRYKCLANVC